MSDKLDVAVPKGGLSGAIIAALGLARPRPMVYARTNKGPRFRRFL